VAPAAAGPIEIELSPDGGSIAGVAVDASGEKRVKLRLIR
jgi:hypothetical protein